ncbi:MAG: flavodoxin [Bacteroidales bacterium]
MKKTLIVYYSYGNNTKQIAERIQEETGADIERIETIVPYRGTEDEVSQQGEDEVHLKFKPEIRPLKHHIADYERIIVGTPTWWYTMAPAMLSFLRM